MDPAERGGNDPDAVGPALMRIVAVNHGRDIARTPEATPPSALAILSTTDPGVRFRRSTVEGWTAMEST